MSVGNLKDYGNKGNNFPWQLKMLQGLQQMIDTNCCKEIVQFLNQIAKNVEPQQRNVKITSTSADGSTADGAYSISIANVGDAPGLVGGQPLPAGVTLNFDAGALNNTLTGVIYDATGTTFLITEMS